MVFRFRLILYLKQSKMQRFNVFIKGFKITIR